MSSRIISPELEGQVLDAVLRSHFPSFLRKVFSTLSPGQTFESGWAVEAMAYQIERLLSGDERRLIVNLPPRSLKSIAFSVALPAFALGLDPRLRIICVSYSIELAKKLANDFRAVVESDWYRRIFPGTRVGRFKNTEPRSSSPSAAIGSPPDRRGGCLSSATRRRFVATARASAYSGNATLAIGL